MIIFFPTYAHRVSGGWSATIAGMVARPLPERSRRRTLAVAVLKRLLELDETHVSSEVFRARTESFLFQRVAGEPVGVTLGNRVVEVGPSDRSGHFQHRVTLDEAFVEAHATREAGRCRLAYAAIGSDPDTARPAGGCIHLVDDAGTSVISDIDDTVKVTEVANRRELLRNTLVREFRAVPGMAAAYRAWHAAGADFHYVSASPWQLSSCLVEFLGTAGLPPGSMHLKIFRLKDSTPLGRLPSRKRSKRRTIERIMADFPGRRFVLVGDSGERDPEVYASLARGRPAQVAAILIREVPAKASRRRVRARLERLAARLPAGMLRTFVGAEEIVTEVSR